MRLLERIRGEFLILAAAVLFACTNTLMKITVTHVPPLQVVWVRFGVPAVLMLVAGGFGWIVLRPQRPRLVLARALFTSLGAVCAFTAAGLTSFGNFSVLIYINPILGTMLSSWWFGESFKPKHIVILLLTFGGVALVMQPSWHGLALGDAVALMAGVFFGIALAIVREAAKTESAWSLTFVFYSLASILCAPIALSHPRPFTPLSLVLITALILIGTTAQMLETAGYRRTSVVVGGTLSYSTVVISILLGAWLFHEPLTPSFLAGAALIVGCGIYLTAL